MKQIPGRIVGNRLCKNVTRAKHFVRFIQGYAWSVDKLKQAKAKGVCVLEIIEDTGNILTIGIDKVLSDGRYFQFGNYERQVGIAETAMSLKDKNQLELFGGAQ